MPYWFQPTTVELEVGGRPSASRPASSPSRPPAPPSSATATPSCWSPSAPRPRARGSTSSRSPSTTSRSTRPPARSRAASSSARRGSRTARSWCAASSIAPAGRCSPTATATRPRSSRPCSPPTARTPADIPAFVGASAALAVSDVPFLGPIAAVRLAKLDGQLVMNPTAAQREASQLDLVVAGSRQALVMVEGAAKQLPEPEILEALQRAHREILPLIDIQEELVRRVGRPKRSVSVPAAETELRAQGARCRRGRHARGDPDPREARPLRQDRRGREARGRAVHRALPAREGRPRQPRGRRGAPRRPAPALVDREGRAPRAALRAAARPAARRRRAHRRPRPDGHPADRLRGARGAPRPRRGAVHPRRDPGAGLQHARQPRRGADHRCHDGAQLQALHAPLQLPAVLGGRGALRCAGPRAATSATANLAERAIQAVLPPDEEFPYTLRVVSEVLESNGSSSMATVCGATLSLLDAGVELQAPVAGIAMGLVEDGDRRVILSDILGDEDHLGDMDFKVAGTRTGITAVQMDIKIRSVDWKVMEQALDQARAGRLHILDCMEAETRAEIPGLTPRRELVALGAALRAVHDQARPHPRHHRPGGPRDPRDPGHDRRQDRRRGRRPGDGVRAERRGPRQGARRWSTSSPRRRSSTRSTSAR